MRHTIRQLEAFVAVCRAGSFTKAASHLCLTQSAVSVLVKHFEDSIGVTLFDRRNSMAPSAAARELLPRIERILSQLETLGSEALSTQDRDNAHFNFAVSAGLAPGLLPRLLHVVNQCRPAIEVTIYDPEPTRLVAKLLEGEVEFCIGHFSNLAPELEVERLAVGQLSAVFLRDECEAAEDAISWDDVLATPVIAPPRGIPLRTVIEDTLAGYNRTLEPAHEVSLFATCVSLAANGFGTAIVPSYFSVGQYSQLVSVPIVGPVITRDLMVLSRSSRPLSSSARMFVEAAKTALAGDAGEERTVTAAA
jgi:LysR family carnitine catabolism transcriptional activator